MQFLTILALIPTVFAGLPAQLRYDPVYGNPSTSTLQTECSDGANGLYTKGYPTLGSLPSFPRVATVPDIRGWNSPLCGSCYKVYYGGTQKVVYVTAVGAGYGNFVASPQVMNTLTNGKAVELGVINVSYAPAAKSFCGF